MWDLNRLRIWRAVVATGSVVDAAKSLNYTSATVSQHITNLQKAVGVPLYRRAGRGIEITDLGNSLAEESYDVFTGLSRLDTLVESFRTREPTPHAHRGIHLIQRRAAAGDHRTGRTRALGHALRHPTQ
ncbi:MAG: LysR family transcriptional regulator [Brevibacterium sp.]|nr:LysR family transcriptional regulator [Brevibacterium sp.]